MSSENTSVSCSVCSYKVAALLTLFQSNTSPARPANPPIPSSTRVKTVSTSSHATTVVPDVVSLLSRLVSPPRSASEERCRAKLPPTPLYPATGHTHRHPVPATVVFGRAAELLVQLSIWFHRGTRQQMIYHHGQSWPLFDGYLKACRKAREEMDFVRVLGFGVAHGGPCK